MPPARRRRDRTRSRLPAVLALTAFALTLLLPGAAEGRPERSVFRSQPLEWESALKKGDRPPALTFTPAWTFNGFHAPLAGNLASAGALLVAASQAGEVVALDPASGTVAWHADLGEPLAIGPAAQPGRVYVGTRSGRLTALDAEQGGRVIWSVDLGSEPTSPPRPLDGRLLIGASAGVLFSLDAADGSVAARRALSGRPVTPPELAGRYVLIGTEGGILMSFDARSLEPRWRRDMRYAISSAPLVYKKRVYVGLSDRSVRCLRLKSGRPIWKARTGAVVAAHPFVRAPYLYLLCYDDDIWVLNARNGHLAIRARLGHRLEAEPALSDHHLFVAPYTEAALVGLSLPGLQTVGQFALDVPGEWFTTAPVLAADRIALGYGRSEGKILALNVAQKQAAPTSGAAPAGAPLAGPAPTPP